MATFPYPIEELSGDKVLQRWRELREAGNGQGFYPVIVGDKDDLENLAGSISMSTHEPLDILRAASTMTGEDVLARRAEQEPELIDDVEVGDWPEAPIRQPVLTHTDLNTGKPKPKVFIAKLPTVNSYEVPAYLRYGGWNHCPNAEEHVAVHRMWSESYGAEIVAVTADVIECMVAHPPQTKEAAMELAKQQFCYCTDIVYQGVETLSALAGGLKDHSAWFFWWD